MEVVTLLLDYQCDPLAVTDVRSSRTSLSDARGTTFSTTSI